MEIEVCGLGASECFNTAFEREGFGGLGDECAEFVEVVEVCEHVHVEEYDFDFGVGFE